MPLDFNISLFIKDPIYGYVELTELEKRIIETPIFQRLRFITQGGLTFFTYPSVRGSRFEHSIGACHLAGRVMMSIVEHSNQTVLRKFLQQLCHELQDLIDNSTFAELKQKCGIHNRDISSLNDDELKRMCGFVIQLVRLLALLHDLGHLPFSHLGEEAIEPHAHSILSKEDHKKYIDMRTKSGTKLHEFLGYKLITEQCGDIGDAFGDPDDKLYLTVLKRFYEAKSGMSDRNHGVFSKLYELVSSDIDVDRGDYLRRDGYASGIGFGTYDVDRLIDSIRLDEVLKEQDKPDFLIAPSDASISAVETFLVERYKLYKWMSYHHSIRYFNYCLIKSLDAVIDLRDQLPRLKDKFNLSYFNFTHYVSESGFICNEIWLWDVFYLAYIDLKRVSEPLPNVRQALVYLDVVTWRRKLGFAIWKTHLDYHKFNKQLKEIICQPCNSSAISPPIYKMGGCDLSSLRERLFFNTILAFVYGRESLKRSFLKKFYKEGIPIKYSDVKNIYGSGLADEDRIGTAFMVVNEFEAFAKSLLSTPERIVSKFEFLRRRPEEGDREKTLRLTEVSQLAASLDDAWQSDVQSYLYFIVSSEEHKDLVARDKRNLLARVVQTKFCEEFAKWILDQSDNKQKVINIG